MLVLVAELEERVVNVGGAVLSSDESDVNVNVGHVSVVVVVEFVPGITLAQDNGLLSTGVGAGATW